MSEQISVSRSDVERARLVVRLNKSLGRATDPSIEKIATAGPGSNDSRNGHHAER